MLELLRLLTAGLLTMSNPPTPTEVLKVGHVIWTCPDVGGKVKKPPGSTYVEIWMPNEGARMVEFGERCVDGKPFGNFVITQIDDKALAVKDKRGKTYSIPLKKITGFKVKQCSN